MTIDHSFILMDHQVILVSREDLLLLLLLAAGARIAIKTSRGVGRVRSRETTRAEQTDTVLRNGRAPPDE